MQGININVKSQEETHTDLNILVFFLFQTVLNYTKYYTKIWCLKFHIPYAWFNTIWRNHGIKYSCEMNLQYLLNMGQNL